MTKLEEVARALYERWNNVPACGPSKPWDELQSSLPGQAEFFREQARAAVEALREPSAHMSVEGHEAAEKALGAMFHYPLADPVWQAMVSALLSEAEQEQQT